MEYVTVNNFQHDGVEYEAVPKPQGCTGCYFRKQGQCQRPEELRGNTCLNSLRKDYKNVVWVKKEPNEGPSNAI